MGVCNVKTFFTLSQNAEDLSMAIADAYYDVQDATTLDNKKFSTADFYDRLVSVLKSENTPFKVEYSSDLTEGQKKLFKQAFAEIRQAILDLIPNEFKDDIKMSELSLMLSDNLQKDLNAGRLKIEGEESDEFTIEQKGALDNDEPIRELRLNQFLSETYQNCFGAAKQMKNIFSREIFTYTMCNFDNGFFITTDSELNESIALYKNELLQRVTKFLKEINPNTSYPSSVYTDEGNVHRRYYDVLSDMQSYLDSINKEQVVNDEYSKSLFGSGSTSLDAIHAYTMLKYFDSLLQETLGKTIKYNTLYKNSEVILDLGKYKFSKDSEHHRKSWTDSENRTAVQNSSRFSKFVLDSIPLKVNGKDTGKNVGANMLNMTISKLFSQVSYLKKSKVAGIKELVEYLYAFHSSPTVYSYRVFSLINNSKQVQTELRKIIKFTEDDLGVIQSLYQYVFSYDSEMNIKKYSDYSNKSIRSMEFNKLKTSYNLGKYSILSDIVGVIDDCMDATYFYTEYGTEGGVSVQKRVKYKDRRGSEKFKDTINAANVSYSQQYREELKDKCIINFTVPTSTQNAIVDIPITISGVQNILQFEVQSSGILGILEQSENIHILPTNNNKHILRRVYELFGEDSPIDLSQNGQRNRLLSDDDNLTEDEQLFKEVLRFIDTRLLTKFLSEDGLQKLNFFKTLQIDSGNQAYINDLLLYSVKSQIVSDIYYDFNSRRLDPNNTFIKSKKDFIKFLRNKYTAFSNITDEQKKTYFISNNGIEKLRTIPSSTAWVDAYAQATLILQGDSSASVSKNQSGNNDANYVTAFLGGQIFNVTYKARQAAKQREKLIQSGENIPQTATSALLFTNHSAAIKQCVINADVKNRAGKVKSIRDLKTSELFYNAIIHNFWTSFINTGEYCIQPTTYSDKVKLIQYLVDGKDYKKFGGKSLSELNTAETIELYRTSIGEASKLALDNVIYTYSKLWGAQLTIDQINQKLKSYTEEQLTREAQEKNIQLQVDFHYRRKKINGKEALLINETLAHQAQYSDRDILINKFKEEEVRFVNSLVDSGVFFYVDYHDTSLHDKNFRNLSIRQQLFKSTSPVANIITSLYSTEAEVEEYFNGNVKEGKRAWVKNGKLVLAYDKDGNPILYNNTTSVAEINPILEKYFYVDSLVANNLRFQLTGFESNHPDKSKFVKMWNNIAEVNKISNQLLSSSKNIERLQESKIIWGHPALGKTTYLMAYPDSIIEWDNEFNPIRNEFIAKVLGDSSQEAKQEFLRQAYNYVSGVGEYDVSMIEAYEQYKQMIVSTWEQVKQKAAKQNKKIFASPTILLTLFENDFDLVLTTDQDTFLGRKPQGLAWKQSIDLLLNSKQSIIDKTINVGNLYMYDIMALNDSFDLHMLSRSSNTQSRKLANDLITIIENISQGTQLKRNVIIPATMHYMHNDLMEGIAKRIKVAIIHDMPAKVFNFSGERDKIDSMDGSAFTTAQQSILENKTLGSQEVGADKKPIWHHYDQDSGTAALMKFASFEINNERMLLSMNSDVPLIRMYKKMTNLPWSNLDQNGILISWNTSNPITLGRSTKLTGINRVQQKLDFNNDILQNKALYYRTYDEFGNIVYKQIVGFGGDPQTGYYTIESYVDEYGDVDMLRPQEEQVYHYFSNTSEHHNAKQQGDHTINSLYELWLAMGGLYSQTIGKNGTMENSESSHYAVVEFMNKTIFPKEGIGTDRFDITQNSYDQPLKEMMIGYLTNNSGMKNGAANRNSVDRWFDEKSLTFMEMDSDGLGVQMDADHDVEEAATMTEFSQVIASLEAGGYLHKYAKQVYKDLGKVAAIASKMEIDTVSSFLAGESQDYDEVKSDLYDLLGRTLLNGIKSRDDQASLTDEILRAIEKRFNQNVDHLADAFKIPFSDSNIYSQILPTVVSMINKKSIKRKYPGSGCVMIPGFNVIQYFSIDGKRYTFNDLARMAIIELQETGQQLPQVSDRTMFERELVKNYLNNIQADVRFVRNSVNDFIPTDVVDVMSGNVVLKTIKLDNLEDYYKFKDLDWEFFKIDGQSVTNFRYNIRQPKNLAPVRITWKRADNGQLMNIFDLKPFRDSYKNPNSINREAVQQAFMDLDKGIFYDSSDVNRTNPIRALDLHNLPAEMIISNMYSNEFGTGSKSIAQIREEGIDAFKVEYESPKESKHYDLVFSKTGGNGVYISFESPRGSRENSYVAYDESNLITEKDKRGNIDVYLISDDNRKLFKVGRYIINSKYKYLEGGYYNNSDNSFISNDEALGREADLLRSGYVKRTAGFYDENNTLIPSKKVSKLRLKADGSTVYEYIEFVSKYKVTERFNDGDDIYHTDEFEKYYINVYNIKNRAFSKGDDNAVNNKQLKTFITNILDDIYATEQFLGITVNSELSKDSAGNIVKFVTNMQNIDNDFRHTVLVPLENELRERLKSEDEIISIESSLRDKYEQFYASLAQARYSSWEQSLYFTAARIPAQTLQSFMQMEAVAYSGNSRNLVYVSHWQAWLQGSDYDIDKAYIMGQEFGKDGRLIKWSNLFDYSSLGTLAASTWLPTPRSLYINNNQDGEGLDISRQLEEISQYIGVEENSIKATKLRKLADLIIDIYDYQDKLDSKSVNLKYSPEYKQIADVIIKDIITHEGTTISPNLEEASYKNSISSNIKNIVQDLKNMDLAYSPIAMGDLQTLASKSEKGALVASMSLMNPLTKYMMQVQNMVGKKVIGIAAVGEKVFFNLSYYFNEGIRSNDNKWIRNMQFSRTFNRIQGRYAAKKEKNSKLISTITKTNLANVNFSGVEDMRRRFLTIDQIDQKVRKELGITDQDIEQKNEKWEQYTSRVRTLVESLESGKSNQELEGVHRTISKCPPVDLLISQVLSAATDNAKELILAKINCGDNLAKCHLYLIMLGFDIKDVVTFMTSPCVSLINDLSEANMMDSYITELRIEDSMDIVDGKIDPSKFLFGSVSSLDEYNSRVEKSRVDSVFDTVTNGKLYNILLGRAKAKNPKATRFYSLQAYLQEYINARLEGEELQPLSSYFSVSDYESRKGFERMSDYIEKLIYSIAKARAKYSNIKEYYQDLEEFKNVYQLANETTTLGGVFLGLNQGLPGSKVDLQNSLRKIKQTITTREDIFGIKASDFTIGVDASEKTKASKGKKYEALLEQLIQNNQFVAGNISDTLYRASAFGIIGNFNVEDWLYDKKLTADDIINDTFMGSSTDVEMVMNGRESISYRELAADYYNIIKGTWNIFDIMNRIPQYEAIMNLYKSVYVIDKHSSLKSSLTNDIYDKVYAVTNFVDEKQNKAIIKYVDDLMVTSFFRENQFSFPIYEGMEYLDSTYKTKIAQSGKMVDLGNAPGRASFKMIMESIVTELQTKGKYGSVEIPNYDTNAFLQGLRIVYDKFEVPRLSLELDMMKINSTPNSQKLYQEYLNGLNQLRTIYINGVSIADWFMLYNLYVNQNQYGSDRLTTMFKASVVNKGSILEQYFKYIGDFDYKKTTDEVLKDLEFNLDDLFIRMAPTVSRSEESRVSFPFIRTRKQNGEMVTKQYIRKIRSYREISTFPNKDLLAINDANVTDDQKSNYQSYQMMPMKNQDFNVSLREGLMSSDLDTLVDTLVAYSRKGLLKIYKENC